jgi:hypothetical protein
MPPRVFVYTVGLGPFSAENLGLQMVRDGGVALEITAQSSSSFGICGAPEITHELRAIPGPTLVIMAHRHDVVSSNELLLRHYGELFFNFRNNELVRFMILFPIPNTRKHDHFEDCLQVVLCAFIF